jgi:TonB family protein
VRQVSAQEAEKDEPSPQPSESQPAFKLVQSQRDYSTAILTVLIIVVALLLGWMLGRVGWHSSNKVERTTVSAATPPPQNTEPTNDAGDFEEIVIQPSTMAPSPSRPKNADKNPNGLVVYQNGQVIFRGAPQKSSASANGSARKPAEADAPESSPSKLPQVPPEVADSQLLRRVEPQYPDRARQQHIQGPVVLQARVGEDGVVQQLRVLTGDAQLAVAAIDAVRRWQFKPYAPNGQPVEFETRITLNFTLPGQSDSEQIN